MKDQTHPPALTAPGEGEGARALTAHTLTQAARSLAEINRPFDGGTTRGDAAGRLLDSLDLEGDGQVHLLVQIRTLDALFNRLVVRAVKDNRLRPKPTDPIIDAEFSMLALQAQRQCRHAVETLALIESRKSKNKLKEPPK